jgi:hypothetical protein
MFSPDLTSQKHIWFIFTCRGLESLKLNVILEKMFKNIEILNLDDDLTKEEKRQILKLHMEANNITETSVQDSMHPEADVLTLHRDSIIDFKICMVINFVRHIILLFT